MIEVHSLAAVAVMAGVTALLRFAPFWIFGPNRAVPAVIERLGALLPGAVMTMLAVYCLRGVSFALPPYALPELIASAITVGLHLWRRRTLLSILGGTVCYMLLIQNIVL